MQSTDAFKVMEHGEACGVLQRELNELRKEAALVSDSMSDLFLNMRFFRF